MTATVSGPAMQLTLAGQANGFRSSHTVTTQPIFPCGKLHTQESDLVLVGTGTQKLNLMAQFFGTNLFLLAVGADGGILLNNGVSTLIDVLPSCLEDGKGARYTRDSAATTGGYSPMGVTILGPIPFGNSDEIVGTYTNKPAGSFITATWNFNLKRKR